MVDCLSSLPSCPLPRVPAPLPRVQAPLPRVPAPLPRVPAGFFHVATSCNENPHEKVTDGSVMLPSPDGTSHVEPSLFSHSVPPYTGCPIIRQSIPHVQGCRQPYILYSHDYDGSYILFFSSASSLFWSHPRVPVAIYKGARQPVVPHRIGRSPALLLFFVYALLISSTSASRSDTSTARVLIIPLVMPRHQSQGHVIGIRPNGQSHVPRMQPDF